MLCGSMVLLLEIRALFLALQLSLGYLLHRHCRLGIDGVVQWLRGSRSPRRLTPALALILHVLHTYTAYLQSRSL